MLKTTIAVFRDNPIRKPILVVCIVMVFLCVPFALNFQDYAMFGIILCVAAGAVALYFQAKAIVAKKLAYVPATIDTSDGHIVVKVSQAYVKSGEYHTAVVDFGEDGELGLAECGQLVIFPAKPVKIPSNIKTAVFWQKSGQQPGYPLAIAENAWKKFVKNYENEFDTFEDE